ncbi:class II fructose-1,6-bisphosphate aldolase [Erysipelothrix inopinata]|uniref:Class II fructose-1,6-bisphosphate aldolase n=1 Tax=Erysipelothrix inopinata TaxID=225084 RepID=A0A7G9S080_9FIRM|nr:class II fructose-1,6-bisphosphate aldolase [Erysipelothrix inopinata]QNN61255.1 class II fructose-1,6-bisphosphate aldolase [Erysipelothrix inopinata]
MALVSAKEILENARDGHYAVPAININNLEWTKAVLSTAQEMNSPILVAVSEGAGKYMTGYKTIVKMVEGMMEELNITVPVALHLDHGSFEGAKKALAAGFTSVMYDGSHLPLDQNLAETREIVSIAHAQGASVEAEVGSIGGEEDGIIGTGELADPAECKMMVDTGIDFLAAGIGNIHGKYPENWAGLSFETLDAIKKATGNIPLVLHGGSGIPTDQTQKAVDLGVAKINVNTELQLAFAAATRKFIEEGKDLEGKNYDPRKLLAPGYQAMCDTVKEKITVFGSANKA